MWRGDYLFLLHNLVLKDFRTRYRNMSLGVLWSVVNPLIMMTVLTFVWTRIVPVTASPKYPVVVLCGLVPFNFFTMAWASSTSSLIDNANIIKRVPIPREVMPLATVLGNCVHLLIQIGLLLTFTLAAGLGVSRHWVWLPVLWVMEIMFVCGLSWITAALNVYVRDTRYVVESVNVILFWLVPIFYSDGRVPERYREIYHLNPVAALTDALRYILLDRTPPPWSILWKLAFSASIMFVLGYFVFRKLKHGFYDYL